MMQDNQLGDAAYGIVFDLDGVISSTATLHASAWAESFNAYLNSVSGVSDIAKRPFDLREDYEKYIDGRPRVEGVITFLESRGLYLPTGEADNEPGFDTANAIGNWKNVRFRQEINRNGATYFSDALKFVGGAFETGFQLGVATSSRNGRLILDGSGVAHLFGVLIDGIVASERKMTGKPAPDIFIACARALGVPRQHMVIIEDAVVGVQAGRNGGFGLVIGVDRMGDRSSSLHHAGADMVVSSLEDVSFDKIYSALSESMAYSKDRPA